METVVPESQSARSHLLRGPWLSIWSLFLGVLFFAANVIGGDLGWGLVSLGLFVVFAAVFYFGGGNETIGGLAAPGRDERWAMINERARAFAGTVVILILIGAWLVEIANGEDGLPYSLVMAGGVIAFFAAALWLRFRS
jgi:hypothetical protein